MRKISLSVFVIIVVFNSFGQGKPHLIQFSGLIVSGDSLRGVPYASVYVPKTGRGVISNQVGFFSMPLLPLDSVVFMSPGYKQFGYKIPKDSPDNLSVMIEMKEDTLMLPVIEIFPYYTEELFKKAFLALRLPDDPSKNIEKTMNDRLIAMLLDETYYDGAMNHRWFTQQQALKQERRFMDPMAYNPLLNPIAWATFINSLKKGDYKDKSYNEDGKKKKKR
ncbi:MAG: carboxypeptidase-like regulatory domain-containing protein [Cytophagales bacterium]